MDTNKIQEMLFDAMQKVKAKLDEECRNENAGARTVCHYSEALTKLAHAIVEVQQGKATTDVMNMLGGLNKLLEEINPT